MGRERRPQGCVPVVAIVLVVAVVVLAIAQETSAFAVPFGGGGGRRQVKAAGGILAALTGGAEDGGGLRRPDGVEIDPIKEMPLEMTAPSPPTTSVLVLSWFYANPRELKLLERVYKRNGFTDVMIHESPVKQLSRPRGWYRTFISSIKEDDTIVPPELCRNFDVVHCMSGGFFNLYLMLAAGVPLGFKRVVLDSTPILPNPASFVQFARAYMEDNGYELVNRVLPRKVHYSAVRLRWTFGSAYINLKHRLRTLKQLRDIKGEVRKVGDTWARNMSKALVRQDYSTLTEHALATVFDREGLESIFLFNPNDPYIKQDDIQMVIEKAKSYGNNVKEVLVDTPHIQTIFRQPAALFDALKVE